MICLFDEDEVVLNEHDIAWRNQDWDAVKKLADSYKEKPESELFKILNNINVGKQNITVSDDYSAYMINSMLSHHIDCIPFVYQMNMIKLSNQHHHDYLMNCIPYGKRFSKSIKLDTIIKDVYIHKLLMAFYKVNSDVAYSYRKLLERKGKLQDVLKKAKALATDDFLKSITKNPKEIKELKNL